MLDFSTVATTLYQITGRGEVDGPLGFHFSNWHVTLATTDDMAGTGLCNPQLYLVDYDDREHYYEPGHARLSATELGSAPAEPTPGNQDDGCEDGNLCTTDTCEAGNVCAHALKADASTCAGGDLCAGLPVCIGGHCTAAQTIDCEDHDPCTVDSCVADPIHPCLHEELPSATGVTCRTTQLKTPPPPALPALQARLITRVLRLVTGAMDNPPQAPRNLNRAIRLVQRFLPPLEQRLAFADVVRMARALLDDLIKLRAELIAQRGTARSG